MIMVKKIRSAKQRANDKRLGQLAKQRFKKTKIRRVVSMAKRRFKRVKTRSKKRGENPIKLIIPSMIYGAVREKISNALIPLTSKVPLGNVADEFVLGAIGFMVAKKVKNPTLKGIGKSMVVLESARIGQALSDGALGGFMSAKTTTTNQF